MSTAAFEDVFEFGAQTPRAVRRPPPPRRRPPPPVQSSSGGTGFLLTVTLACVMCVAGWSIGWLVESATSLPFQEKERPIVVVERNYTL